MHVGSERKGLKEKTIKESLKQVAGRHGPPWPLSIQTKRKGNINGHSSRGKGSNRQGEESGFRPSARNMEECTEQGASQNKKSIQKGGKLWQRERTGQSAAVKREQAGWAIPFCQTQVRKNYLPTRLQNDEKAAEKGWGCRSGKKVSKPS